MNRGIVEACTGVIRLNPMLDTASSIHSASGGVKASHARGDAVVIGSVVWGLIVILLVIRGLSLCRARV